MTRKETLAAAERWKPVPGYENEYFVSDKGRVKSIGRTIVRNNGRPQTIKERILKPSPDEWGYPQVGLSGDTFKVHRLVAQTFLEKRPIGSVIRHKDGNPHNSEANNLEYGTQLQNVLDCYRYRGFLTKRQKIMPEDAVEIRRQIENGESCTALAKKYNVSLQNICDIKSRRTFAWMEGQK